MKRSLALLAVMTLAVMLAPGASHGRFDDTCNREQIYGRLIQPDEGDVIVTTQAGVPIALDGMGQPIVISTTGQIQVVAAYGCLMNLTLTVTKTDPITGAQTPHSTHTWSDEELNGPEADPGAPSLCGRDLQVSTNVDIGLDAGEFDFQLTGESCLPGIAIRDDGHGGFVADPPLPL